MKISFLIRKDHSSDLKPIYLHIIRSRSDRSKFKLDFKVEEKLWDDQKQRIRAGHPHRHEINNKLSEIESASGAIVLELSSRPFSEVKMKVNSLLSGKSNDWWNTWELFQSSQSKVLSPRTIQKYNFVRDLIRSSGLDCSFQSFDQKWFDNYIHYMIEKGYMNDTLSRYISILKTFLRWSFERAHHNNTAFLSVKTEIKKLPRHDVVALTYDELMTYFNFPMDGMKEKAREIFCFAAFTGARLSDIQSFNPLQATKDGWEFEAYKTRKLKKKVKIPFTGYFENARTILERNGWNLPKLNDANINKGIKEGLKLAGIDSEITLTNIAGNKYVVKTGPKYQYVAIRHARATCASILLNELNIPISIVQKQVLLHSDIQTTMKYENNTPEHLINAMNQAVRIKKSSENS